MRGFACPPVRSLLEGLEGKLTNAKREKLAKCSPDTGLRDLQYLVDRGVLVRGPEGCRSTSYLVGPVGFEPTTKGL